MRLLLDEHLSPAIAEALREGGHDAVAIKERAEWVQLPDDDVIELARAERRAVVTNTVRDYRPRATALVTAGTQKIDLQEETIALLAAVDKPTNIQVFSTPT